MLSLLFFDSFPNSGERTKCGVVRASRLREHATGSIRMEAGATPYQHYGLGFEFPREWVMNLK